MQEINFHPLYTSLLHVDEINTVIHVDCSFVNKRKTWSKNNIGCPEDSLLRSSASTNFDW